MPREDSTGGKQKLGPISKQGDRYLRRILVVGAHAVLRLARQKPEKYPWLTQLLARRPFKVVAVALANKMARVAWALLAKGGTYYRARALVAPGNGLIRSRRWKDEVASVAFTNCKGDDDVDAKRSRPSIGQPVWATRDLSACFCLGPISGSHQGQRPQRPLRHGGKPPGENRPYTWLHPNASQNVKFLLHRGRRPYMAHRVISRQRSRSVALRGKADIGQPLRIGFDFTSTRAR